MDDRRLVMKRSEEIDGARRAALREHAVEVKGTQSVEVQIGIRHAYGERRGVHEYH